jgi:hypothetical protein
LKYNPTLKPNKGVSWLENNPNLQQGEEPISKGVAEASQSPFCVPLNKTQKLSSKKL